jgi:AraC-like DNA-binding protein
VLPSAMASGRLVPRDVFRRLVAASEYIEDRHAEPLVLADVAACAGISPFHFLRLYRQAFGMTPHEHLTRVRLAHARDLLVRGGASVTETCFEVGYASLGSFSTLFARRFGASPDAYRRRVRRLVDVPGQIALLHVPCCFMPFFAAAKNRNSREAAPAAP